MDRFSKRHDLSDDDVMAVSVQDTYVDSGVGVAQVVWETPGETGQLNSGLVQVPLEEGLSLSRLLHRTLYVRRRDIQAASTRFDQEE